MNRFQDIVDAYRTGALVVDEAARQLSDLITDGITTTAEIQQRLDRELLTGGLSQQGYLGLKRRLADRAGASDPASDATRIPGATGPARAAEPMPEHRADAGAPTVVQGQAGPPIPGGRPGHAIMQPRASSTRRTATLGEGTAPTEFATGTAAARREGPHMLAVGDTLKDRFVLEEVLGAGGMGVVFKALDLRKKEANDRDPYVALKVLNQEFQENPVSLIALQRETKRAQTLSHPNIINVYDFDRDGPYVYMSMEYLDEQPLSQFIRQLPEGGLAFSRAWSIIEGMGSALAYAHKKNIIHSDFKPANVFISKDGEVKVLDFGIACAAGRSSDQEAREKTLYDPRSLGALTPAYAALEMFEGADPDPRDDIYGLACVTYELLTGKHPFGKLTAKQVLDLNLQPKPVRSLSRRRWRALQRALSLQRADRTPSVDEFLKELQGRSALFYGGWVFAVLLALVSGANIYFNRISDAVTTPKVPVVLTAEQQEKLKHLLEVAEIHFEVGYLTAPAGTNALWAYQEALKLDPYNEPALQGIRKIGDALEQAAWESYERGDRADSLDKVEQGLKADPRHAGLLKLKKKLQK